MSTWTDGYMCQTEFRLLPSDRMITAENLLKTTEYWIVCVYCNLRVINGLYLKSNTESKLKLLYPFISKWCVKILVINDKGEYWRKLKSGKYFFNFQDKF